MLAHWMRDLGSPQEPGDVYVNDYGVVTVTAKHIEIAATYAGNLSFNLEDVTSTDSVVRHYLLKSLAHPDR